MKIKAAVMVLVLSALAAGTGHAEGTYSGRAVQESARGMSHAAAGVMYGAVASGQAVSAAAAVPFTLIGSVGAVSTCIGQGLTDAATAPAGAPLPIADEIVTAGPPPDQALRKKPGAAAEQK